MKVSIFLKYPQHVLITFTLQSQIINHNIYINSSSHDLQWVSYKYHDKRKSPINGLFTPFMKLCLLFKLFPKEVSSNQKCWFYAAFHRIFFIKCYSFHIVFKNFSSKLVAMIRYCTYEFYGRYNLLLLLKTNNQMWLTGA